MGKIKDALLNAEETYGEQFNAALDNQDYESAMAMMLGVK